MLDFIREGDTVFVPSMDRLARNLDDLRKLVNLITNEKITLTFVKENLTFAKNDTNPIATLMLSVMGAFAEFERSLIKERQLEGIALAKQQGKYTGRNKKLTNAQLDEVKQLVLSRHKKIDIARKFGLSRMTLYRYIKNTHLDESTSI